MFDKDYQYFKAHEEELQTKCKLPVVLIANEKLEGEYSSFNDALKDGLSRFGYGNFIIEDFNLINNPPILSRVHY